jgi:hypothetical protein
MLFKGLDVDRFSNLQEITLPRKMIIFMQALNWWSWPLIILQRISIIDCLNISLHILTLPSKLGKTYLNILLLQLLSLRELFMGFNISLDYLRVLVLVFVDFVVASNQVLSLGLELFGAEFLHNKSRLIFWFSVVTSESSFEFFLFFCFIFPFVELVTPLLCWEFNLIHVEAVNCFFYLRKLLTQKLSKLMYLLIPSHHLHFNYLIEHILNGNKVGHCLSEVLIKLNAKSN